MEFEVYCDENNQDLLCCKKADANRKYTCIGSLWIPRSLRSDLKLKIKEVRLKHQKFGEIKWNKVSRSGLDFYKSIIDIFLSYGEEMRFRCIAIEAEKVNWSLHDNDRELGFYKFYYQMLHQWILDFNEYSIFCDFKTNKKKDELHTLRKCLSSANLSSEITQVQSLPSKNIVLIQIADLFLGIASSRLNKSLKTGGAKEELVRYLEKRLNVSELQPTQKYEQKFNIFKINLEGGW